MSKHAKDNKKNRLRDASAEDDSLFSAEITYDKEPKEDELRPVQLPKALYLSGAALILVIIGLTLWMNRAHLTPESIGNWVKQQTQGTGAGDGFPVSVLGNEVAPGNFWHIGSNAAAVSDTALTVVDTGGKTQHSVRHSYENPFYSQSGDYLLLYNQGNKGYMLLKGFETEASDKLKVNILTGAVSKAGSYALATLGGSYASELHVYDKDGKEKYFYGFADQYITSISLNSSGTMGAVCSMGTEKGETKSRITILDFNREDAVSQWDAGENMLLQVLWSENNIIYAVGDTAVLVASAGEYQFTEYSYNGMQLTTYQLENNRAAVSVSGFAYSGACTLLLFRDNTGPVQVQTQQRVRSLSLYGDTVGALEKNSVVLYDGVTGKQQTEIPVDSDSKAIALANEKTAYVLAIAEIRLISAG